jgi:hypothetical protein
MGKKTLRGCCAAASAGCARLAQQAADDDDDDNALGGFPACVVSAVGTGWAQGTVSSSVTFSCTVLYCMKQCAEKAFVQLGVQSVGVRVDVYVLLVGGCASVRPPATTSCGQWYPQLKSKKTKNHTYRPWPSKHVVADIPRHPQGSRRRLVGQAIRNQEVILHIWRHTRKKDRSLQIKKRWHEEGQVRKRAR